MELFWLVQVLMVFMASTIFYEIFVINKSLNLRLKTFRFGNNNLEEQLTPGGDPFKELRKYTANSSVAKARLLKLSSPEYKMKWIFTKKSPVQLFERILLEQAAFLKPRETFTYEFVEQPYYSEHNLRLHLKALRKKIYKLNSQLLIKRMLLIKNFIKGSRYRRLMLKYELEIINEKFLAYQAYIESEERRVESLIKHFRSRSLQTFGSRDQIHGAILHAAFPWKFQPGKDVIVTIYDVFSASVPESMLSAKIDMSLLPKPEIIAIEDVYTHGFAVTEIARLVAPGANFQLLDLRHFDDYKWLNSLTPACNSSNLSAHVECKANLPTVLECVRFMDCLQRDRTKILVSFGDDSLLYISKIDTSDFIGDIINMSHGVLGDEFPRTHEEFLLTEPTEPSFADAAYLRWIQYKFLTRLDLYYSLIEQRKIVVFASGNYSLDLTSSSHTKRIMKAIASRTQTARFLLIALNLDSDGLHLHGSTCQPGSDGSLSSRSISAIGSQLRLDGIRTDKEELTAMKFGRFSYLYDILLYYGFCEKETITGTSFSAPYIAGMLACLKSLHMDIDIDLLAQVLLDSATPIVSIRGEPCAVMFKNKTRRAVTAINFFPGEYLVGFIDSLRIEKVNRKMIDISRSKYGMGRANLGAALRLAAKRFPVK